MEVYDLPFKETNVTGTLTGLDTSLEGHLAALRRKVERGEAGARAKAAQVGVVADLVWV